MYVNLCIYAYRLLKKSPKIIRIRDTLKYRVKNM